MRPSILKLLGIFVRPTDTGYGYGNTAISINVATSESVDPTTGAYSFLRSSSMAALMPSSSNLAL
jgi:hypothetical protein